MSNIHSLDRLKKDNEPSAASQGPTSSYAGGEHSGLAIQNPNDADGSGWQQAISSAPIPKESTPVILYKNGFIVNDGPFRPLEDPVNAKFVKNIQSGIVPEELRSGNATVNVALLDRRSEEYRVDPAVAAQVTLFSGEGMRVGKSKSTTPAAPVNLNKGTVIVDETKPMTTLQLRLHNGQKRIQRFNQSHTVADLHAFIMEIAPVYGEYRLLSGFPPIPIDVDPNVNLKDAGLLQAVITQSIN